MIVVVQHFTDKMPVIVEAYKNNDKQTLKDAYKLANYLKKENKCDYKVFVERPRFLFL